MLLKIKYPLLIKFWSKYFLSVIGLISIYSFTQVFINKISLYIAIYYNKLSKFKSKSFVLLKILSLKLQHSLQFLFKLKFTVYIFDIFNLISSEQTENFLYLNQKVFKSKLQALSLNKAVFDIFYLSLQFKLPVLLLNYLSKIFSQTKSQRNLLDLIQQLFKEFYANNLSLKGFKLYISGKVDGASRTSSIAFNAGNFGLFGKSSNSYYAYLPSNTFTGTFGFKLWLSYKK
jgi:hypothetical protein